MLADGLHAVDKRHHQHTGRPRLPTSHAQRDHANWSCQHSRGESGDDFLVFFNTVLGGINFVAASKRAEKEIKNIDTAVRNCTLYKSCYYVGDFGSRNNFLKYL